MLLEEEKGSQEDQSKSPNLKVCTGCDPVFEVPWRQDCIVTVLVDTAQDEVTLPLVQKVPSGLVCFVWEIDKEEISYDSDDAGQDPLHYFGTVSESLSVSKGGLERTYEYPSPTKKAC